LRHPNADDPGLVPADGIECEGGVVRPRIDDPPVRHEPQFDERLETVADAGHQAAAPIQQRHGLLLHRGCGKKR
jgi:hypothetical protein